MPQTFASKPSVRKVVNPEVAAVASPANSPKYLKFSTSQSGVLEVRTLPNPVASMAVEQQVVLREWKAPVVEQVISESVTRLAPGLLLPEAAAVAALVLDQEAEQEEAWLVPTEKPARDLEDWVVLSQPEVWVVQHMVMAPLVPQVIGESEALVAMAHSTEVAVAVAVTTAVAVVEQMLTHAAPMPAAAAVDLHTPTHLL
jgi:hypothetical protein